MNKARWLERLALYCCCFSGVLLVAETPVVAQGTFEAVESCCLPDGSCQLLTKQECLDRCGYAGGTVSCQGVLCAIEIPIACCLPDGQCAELSRCECEAMHGTVQHAYDCDDVACRQPTGACCLPNGGCTIITKEECEAQCGIYRGDGTNCNQLCYHEIARPCCLPDGSCINTTSCLCEQQGGTIGNGWSCQTMEEACPRPKGACCLEDDDGCSSCYTMYEDDCLDRCGIFLGPDEACPDFCPAECTHPCCLPDGTCRDATRCLCNALGGTVLSGDHCADTPDECGCPDTTCSAIVPGSPSDIGSWEQLPQPSPVMIVHAATMYNGKVLMFAGELEGYFLPHDSVVWDPATGNFSVQTNAFVDDLFCAGHAQLADGRIIVVGGAENFGQGIVGTNIFDPATETWTKVADMAHRRWYPTALTMADGKIITFSGWIPPIVPQVEVYDPVTDVWTQLPASADKSLEIYPSVHLMPDGNIVYTGTRWSGGTGWPSPPPTSFFNPSTNTWTNNVATHPVANRIEGFSVQMPNDLSKFMVVGGECNGAGTQKSTEIIDMAAANPTWVTKANTNYERKNVNGVLLPDGNILLCTGISGYKWSPVSDTLESEMWVSATETWKPLDSMNVVGQYHSISLLLPDGRVLKGGGQDAGPLVYDLEVYSPPYLFRGPRPVISSAPGNVTWNQVFNVQSADACNIKKISMIRLSTITHHTNTDQRLIEPAWTYTGGNNLSITAPANGNIAPPGYYMLFILNDCGVPSEAAMVRIG